MCAKYRERDSLINLLAVFGNRKYILIFCTNQSNRNQENGTIIEEEKVRLEI